MKKLEKAAAAMAVAVALIAGSMAPAMAADGDTSALNAVAQANPGAVEQSADVAQTADAVVDAELGGIDVTLPSVATDGIELSRVDGKGTLSLSLPFADQAADAERPAAGVAEYDNGNGSTTVPVAVDDGTVAVHTVIESADAPTSYAYGLSIDEGSTFEVWDSGEIVILDASGDFQFAIAAPWARDANGNDVPTHYELDGTTLTQVVEHTSSTAYPVVADPSIGGFYMDWYSWNAAGDRITIQPTFAGYTFNPALVAQYGWIEVRNATPRVNQATLHQQFMCHALGNFVTVGQTWDLESWRGLVTNPADMIGSLCNW